MIVVRNVFRLKFGKSREAIALWKEGAAIMQKSGAPAPERILTDAVGQFYTLVVENKSASLTQFEETVKGIQKNPDWQAWYQKFTEVCESGHREIFNIVE